MKKLIATTILSAASALAGPLYTATWTNDAADPRPCSLTVLAGETVGLSAQLNDGCTPLALPANALCTLYYQTNGMGSSWWSAPGEASTNGRLSAVWTPDMDPGASRVQFFLGAGAGGASLYRAFGTLSIRHAPGAEPNALPWPQETVDFARVAWTNAPWATLEDLAASTNGIRTVESDPVALPLIGRLPTYTAVTNTVLMALPNWRITDGPSNVVWQIVASNGCFQIFREEK